MAKRWSEKKILTAIELYQSGLSMRQVVRKIGGKQETLKIYLIEKKIPIRPVGSYFLGKKNHRWKNGIRLIGGYFYIYMPDHPHCTRHKVYLLHRLIMERHLGRYLSPKEVVDHINRIISDNRLENLRLFSSNSEHLRITLKGKRPKWSEKGIKTLSAFSFAKNLKHYYR